jgi:hypothetical protein
MQPDARVCPFCGDEPGPGSFCAACGRNLMAVEQLPTRAEWEAQRPDRATTEPDAPPLAERCAEATAAFLAAMHAAGDPGATDTPMTRRSTFGRTPKAHGWVLRPVARDEDDEDVRRYEPGLLLTTDGDFHRIESEVRGWGQRNFPQFYDSADPDAIDTPVDERLVDELAAVRSANDV